MPRWWPFGRRSEGGGGPDPEPPPRPFTTRGPLGRLFSQVEIDHEPIDPATGLQRFAVIEMEDVSFRGTTEVGRGPGLAVTIAPPDTPATTPYRPDPARTATLALRRDVWAAALDAAVRAAGLDDRWAVGLEGGVLGVVDRRQRDVEPAALEQVLADVAAAFVAPAVVDPHDPVTPPVLQDGVAHLDRFGRWPRELHLVESGHAAWDGAVVGELHERTVAGPEDTTAAVVLWRGSRRPSPAMTVVVGSTDAAAPDLGEWARRARARTAALDDGGRHHTLLATTVTASGPAAEWIERLILAPDGWRLAVGRDDPTLGHVAPVIAAAGQIADALDER